MNLKEFAATRHHAFRPAKPAATPAWINGYADQVRQEKLTKAIQSHAHSRRWFYVADPGDYKKRWDEVSTATVYNQLVDALGIEHVPGYTAENHRTAIQWWQSWQNRTTGRFYNPLMTDPQNPDDAEEFCNEKYVVGILHTLSSAPLYPFTTISGGDGEAGKVDVEAFYRQTSDLTLRGEGSWAGKMCTELMSLIEQGQDEFIPVLERGISNLLQLQSPDTGLWSTSTDYADYGTTSDALKILGRLHYRLGVENLPHMKALVDTLINHRHAMQSKHDSVLRNTGELLGICLETIDYRREELHQTMAQHAEAFRNHLGTNYSVYGLGFLGGYLHWTDCQFKNPVVLMSRGAQWTYRVVVASELSVRLIEKASAAEKP